MIQFSIVAGGKLVTQVSHRAVYISLVRFSHNRREKLFIYKCSDHTHKGGGGGGVTVIKFIQFLQQ